jgi:hypothetical protein
VINVNDDKSTSRFMATLPSVKIMAAAILASRQGTNSYGHHIGQVAAVITTISQTVDSHCPYCLGYHHRIVTSRRLPILEKHAMRIMR